MTTAYRKSDSDSVSHTYCTLTILTLLGVSGVFSKYLIVKATKTQTVFNLLNELTTYFGLPSRIVSDRGTAFTAKVFEDYCMANAIQHIKNAVRTPRANGQIETNEFILSFTSTGINLTPN